MGKQVVGLKIGASGLTAARVSVNGSVEVAQVARGPLPPGVVSAGEVRDVDALAEALKEFFGKHKLPRRAVRVGIANNRVGVRAIELQGIDDPKQLANAVRFRAQEVLPIPIDEAVLDFQVLSEGTNHEGFPTRRVLLVVAYRDLVDAYVRACKQAGIRIAGVDLEAFALLRSVVVAAAEAEPAAERSAIVAVGIGSERSTLAVSDGLSCDFTRVLDWGGSHLTAALVSTLGIEAADAEALKMRLSLDDAAPLEEVTADQAQLGREALREALQGFARELVSSLQFYQSQPDSLGIREIVLAGGTAELGGLADALQRLVGVAVRVGDPFAGVTVGKKARDAASPAFAVPVGLGMGV